MDPRQLQNLRLKSLVAIVKFLQQLILHPEVCEFYYYFTD